MEWFFGTTPGPVGNTTFGEIGGRSQYVTALAIPMLFLELDDSAANADGHCLRAIACSQLLHDVLDVNLYCFFGDEELLSDVSIPVSARDLTQDLDFTFGEGFVTHMFSKLSRQLRRYAFFSCVDLANDLH
jgi:hypothetical protein